MVYSEEEKKEQDHPVFNDDHDGVRKDDHQDRNATTTAGSMSSSSSSNSALPPSLPPALPPQPVVRVDNDDNNNSHNMDGTETSSFTTEKSSTRTSSSNSSRNGNNNATTTEGPAVVQQQQRSSSSPKRIALAILRLVLLDLPLILVILANNIMYWVEYVHGEYLHPQLNAMIFNNIVPAPRVVNEMTYFNRKCTMRDITTQNPKDLFLSSETTPREAYEHQLYHGFTVFPNVLSEQTIHELRTHIVSRNANLTERETIFVIENDNRYSYGLGTEEPSVRKAMMEIANHQQLHESLELILGRNPALIEMTAITSSYGAIDQYYHDDVIPEGSPIRYARTFGPSYSVFIVLQNTTKEMGATGACPGTHYCNYGNVEELCEKEAGFQVVGSDGYWKAGDALLMNMNSHHRGSGHTDPDAEDRVMLILTFSPRPMDRAESRMMSQGITFSLRWDMWGHTLHDLQHADTLMQHPWALFRALGIYKLPGTDWGVDWITGSSQRIANNDYGYKDDELDEYIEMGGWPYLPKFLQGEKHKEDDNWYEYIQDTWYKCLDFADQVLYVSVGCYVVVSLLLSLFRQKGQRLATSCKSLLRLCLFLLTGYALCHYAKQHVDQSSWAADIRADRRYTGFFSNLTKFGIDEPGSTTLPNRHDVLIETRYGSEYLHMYEDYIDGHPGNRYFLNLVQERAAVYASYPAFLKKRTAIDIIENVEFHQGRFLYQGPHGRWHWIPYPRALEYVNRQLASHSHPMKRTLTRKIRHIQSQYMYGVYRATILAQKWSVPYLRELEDKILGLASISDGRIVEKMMVRPGAREGGADQVFKPVSILDKVPLRGSSVQHQRPSGVFPEFEVEEPFPGAWITGMEEVEHLYDGYWYLAQVRDINALGGAMVWYESTKEVLETTMDSVRNFEEYEVGEELEVWVWDGEYLPCTIESLNEDGSYNVHVVGEEVFSAAKNGLRRKAHEGDVVEKHERKATYG